MRLNFKTRPSRKAKQNWHKRYVWFPRIILTEHGTREFCFLESMEARWSSSRSVWLWRTPRLGVVNDREHDSNLSDGHYQPAE